jgi:hypothetical protein
VLGRREVSCLKAATRLFLEHELACPVFVIASDTLSKCRLVRPGTSPLLCKEPSGAGPLSTGSMKGAMMSDPRRPDVRQDEAVRANYRREEAREKSLSGEQLSSPQSPAKPTVKTRGAVTGHNVQYVLAFGLAGVIIAFIVIAMYFGLPW